VEGKVTDDRLGTGDEELIHHIEFMGGGFFHS
jgi:hypothetical protein